MLGRAVGVCFIGALAVSMLATAPRASGAVADFEYGTTITPSPINATASIPAQGSVVSLAGVGNFASPTSPAFNAAVNPAGADIVVGTITVVDLGLGAYTDTYGPTPITVDLNLRDVDSGNVGTFIFNGTLSGIVASNGTTSASTFTNPFIAASQTQTIGAQSYTVSIIPTADYAAPGSPPPGGAGLAGQYTFHVSVPEPSSLALAGLAALGLLRRRRAISV